MATTWDDDGDQYVVHEGTEKPEHEEQEQGWNDDGYHYEGTEKPEPKPGCDDTEWDPAGLLDS